VNGPVLLKENSFLKGFFEFSFGTWIAAAISFLTTPLVTWLIVPEEFGRASMFLVGFNLLITLSLMGMDQGFVRAFHERDEEKRRELLWECLLPSLALCLLFSAIMLFFWDRVSTVLFDKVAAGPIFFLEFIGLCSIVERFAALVIRMKGRGVVFSVGRLAGSLANTIGIVLYAFIFSRTFHAVLFGLFLSTIVSLVIEIHCERGFWRRPTVMRFDGLREIVTFSLPLVPACLIDYFLQSTDKLSLRNYSGFHEIGIYNAGFRVVAVLSLVQAGFVNFWAPVVYETYEKDTSHTLFFQRVSAIVSYVMLALAVVVIGAKDLIVLFLSSSYRDAARVIPFLALMPVMYTISETTVIGINLKKKTHWHIWIALSALGVNVVCNLIFVPFYGAVGAALSVGLSYVVLLYLRTFISGRVYRVDYHPGKLTFSVLVVLGLASLATLTSSIVIAAASSLVSLSLLSIIYRKECADGWLMVMKGLRGRKPDFNVQGTV
jgi:O-antigen/teichoic acid export membrane protein